MVHYSTNTVYLNRVVITLFKYTIQCNSNQMYYSIEIVIIWIMPCLVYIYVFLWNCLNHLISYLTCNVFFLLHYNIHNMRRWYESYDYKERWNVKFWVQTTKNSNHYEALYVWGEREWLFECFMKSYLLITISIYYYCTQSYSIIPYD